MSLMNEQAYVLVEKLSRYSLTREMGDDQSGSDKAFDEVILEARAIVLRGEKETTATELMRKMEHVKTVAHGYAETIARQDAEIKTLHERIATLENGEAISIAYIRTLEGVNKERHERIAYLEEATASKGEHKFISFEQWKENFK